MIDGEPKSTKKAQSVKASKRAAELESQARKKRECEKKALTIVERLLSDCVSEEFLLDTVKFMNAEFYGDAVIERSIIKVCGYPLCNNPLKNIPKQKFHISLKTNKVYDITERKNFCSPWCFQASTYFKNQLPISNLWDQDRKEIGEVKLLQKTEKCRTQHEVDLQSGLITRQEVQLLEKDDATIAPPEADVCSVRESVDDYENINHDKDRSSLTGRPNHKKYSQTTLENKSAQFSNIDVVRKDESHGHLSKSSLEGRRENNVCNKLEAMTLNTCSDGGGILKAKDLSSNGSGQDDVGRIENNLTSNVSKVSNVKIIQCNNDLVVPQKEPELERTGQEVKQNSNESDMTGNGLQCAKTTHLSELEIILSRLKELWTRASTQFIKPSLSTSPTNHCEDHGQEIQPDVKTDQDVSHVSIVEDMTGLGRSQQLEKLPNFTELEKDAKLQQLRVKEYFSGTFKYPSSHDAAHDEDKKEEEGAVYTMPPIDSRSQVAIRRKIFLERLHKSLPDVVTSLGLSLTDINTPLRQLVVTFHLTSKNIVLKPKQWKILCLLLIVLIGHRERNVQEGLESPHAKEFLCSMLADLGSTVLDVNQTLDIILTV